MKKKKKTFSNDSHDNMMSIATGIREIYNSE